MAKDTPHHLAIIDLGTNTFHLLIVELGEDEQYIIREKFKEPVKLGEGGINSGEIAPRAYKRGIAALAKFAKLIESRGVEDVLAFGTSALRSAKNAKDFIKEARRAAGVKVRVIGGNEEAALIYKGVRRGVAFPPGEDVLLVDIGGGSVEFIVGDPQEAKLLRSLKLGAARLLEAVNPQDPITEADIEKAHAIIGEQLDPLLEELKEFQLSTLVGSSGTFETLSALAAYDAGDLMSMDKPNGYTYSPAIFNQLRDKLLRSTREQRKGFAGMDPVRIDMILMGVILVDYVLQRLELEQILVSEFALKEGILYDYLEELHDSMGKPSSKASSLREKTVLGLCKRYNVDMGHSEQVAKLAGKLFDLLKPHHNLGPEARNMLVYAAYLHDIGHFIKRSGHHKHGQYILLNSELPGFNSNEIHLLANLVRYHRKSLPTPEHFHYNVLYPADKDMIRKLGGLLRIADNLDRGHRHLIEDIRLGPGTTHSLLLWVSAKESVEIELEAARHATEMFDQAFGLRLKLEQK